MRPRTEKIVFVVARVLGGTVLYLVSALTRDAVVFVVSLTWSVAFAIVHAASYARADTESVALRAATATIFATSVVLAFFSLVFPLQPALRETTFVFFVLGLAVAATVRVRQSRGVVPASAWRWAVHAWEWTFVALMAALGLATLIEADAERKQTLQTTIVALVGLASVSSVLDIDFESE